MGKTSDYYKSHPEARKKRLEYQADFNKKPEQLKKRVDLNKDNRKRGTYGNGDGLDVSHKKGGKTVLESASKTEDQSQMLRVICEHVVRKNN